MTAALSDLQEIAAKAIAIHGHVDVVVNSAGYVEFGSIEETTYASSTVIYVSKRHSRSPYRPEETMVQFNTNVFGTLNVTRAFLPHMRGRKSGTVVFIGSLLGWV